MSEVQPAPSHHPFDGMMGKKVQLVRKILHYDDAGADADAAIELGNVFVAHADAA